jgi:hypothetical protein
MDVIDATYIAEFTLSLFEKTCSTRLYILKSDGLATALLKVR